MKSALNRKLEEWLDRFFASNGGDETFEDVAAECGCSIEEVKAGIHYRCEAMDRAFEQEILRQYPPKGCQICCDKGTIDDLNSGKRVTLICPKPGCKAAAKLKQSLVS